MGPVRQNFLVARQALLSLEDAVALDDAGAAELIGVLLVLVVAQLGVHQGVQLLFDVHESSMQSLSLFFSARETRLLCVNARAATSLVCIQGKVVVFRTLILTQRAFLLVNACAGGQDAALVFAFLLCFDFSHREIKRSESGGFLADSFCFFVHVDAYAQVWRFYAKVFLLHGLSQLRIGCQIIPWRKVVVGVTTLFSIHKFMSFYLQWKLTFF